MLLEQPDLPKVDLGGVSETMLITLYARALDFRARLPVLADRWADEAVRRIDYDFEKLRLGAGDAFAIAARGRQIDLWAGAFLARHAGATVVHLACGLDSRVFRLDPPSDIAWCDIDLPDVVALREALYPPRPGYRLVAASATEGGWLASLPMDRPALVIAEGLLMYLTRREVRQLLERVTRHFAEGEIVFDVLSPLGARLAHQKPAFRRTGARFQWVVDEIEDIRRVYPRLELAEQSSILASPFLSQAPLGVALFCRAASLVPTLRDMHRLVRYTF